MNGYSGHSQTDETRKKIGNSLKGRIYSEEHRRHISEARKGIPRSEETKERLSIAHTGKHLSEEHKRKIGEAGKGKKRSEEIRQKMSDAQKRRWPTKETTKQIGDTTETKTKKTDIPKKKDPPIRLVGDKHPMFGKHHTEEAKEKMRIAHLGKKNPNAGNRGKKGDLHPNWKGGRTPIRKSIRESIQYKNWRKQCFLRDDFTCQYCGARGTTLNVHHEKSFIKLLKESVDAFPLLSIYDAAMAYTPFWDIENGKTLCTYCHNVLKHKYKQEPSIHRMLNGDGRVKRHQSEETRLKIRLANLGKHPSKETRKKMSESAIKFQQAKKAISIIDNYHTLLRAVNA